MTHLNAHAKQALETLAVKHIAYVTGLEVAREELRIELEARTAGLRMERDIALRIADDAGVPRTRLGKTIGTTNYKTVQDILLATADSVHVEQSASGVVDSRWSAVDLQDGTFNVTVTNIGAGAVTGSVVVSKQGDDMVFVSGDEFVIPQIYRNGLAEAVLNAIV
jgi:hypothetical protein